MFIYVCIKFYVYGNTAINRKSILVHAPLKLIIITILTVAQGYKKLPIKKTSFVIHKIQHDIYDDSFTEHPAKGRQECIMK